MVVAISDDWQQNELSECFDFMESNIFKSQFNYNKGANTLPHPFSC